MSDIPQPDLQPLLDPKSIALIGASPSSRVGRAILENLLHLGYAGSVYPVNPKYEEVLGYVCYPSISDIPNPVDAVLIATSTGRVLQILEECAEKGVRAAVVTADGFADSGPEGMALQDQLAAIARQSGMVICGPNCMGILNTASGVSLYTGALNRALPTGSVSVVLQSGSAGIALMNNLRGLGFRFFISSGNEAVVPAADYIHYLAEDEGTRVIALMLEGIREPERLLSAVELAHSRGKPVVLLKLGTSAQGRDMSAAHTGALAGSIEVTEGVCRQFGIIMVKNLEELLSTCLLLSRFPLPEHSRAGAVTLSGGYATLAADLGSAVGIEFPPWEASTTSTLSALLPPERRPRNPFDAWGTGDFRMSLRESIAAIQQDRATDFLMIWQDLPPENAANGIDVPRALLDLLYELGPLAKPTVIMGTLIDPPAEEYPMLLEKAGVAYLQEAEIGLRALALWSSARELMGRSSGRSADRNSSSSPALDGWDAESLRQSGIPLTRERLARSPDEARDAADLIGYPVVLKVQSSRITHRSDVGGVSLGVGPEVIEETYERLLERVEAAVPRAPIEGVLVQEQQRPGIELIVGATREPDWGWVLMVGLGGLFVETLRDVSFRRVPLRRSDAESMISELQASPVLLGTRGGPPLDIEALVELLTKLGALLQAHGGAISQIEFNPVILYPRGEGLAIVDLLVMSRD